MAELPIGWLGPRGGTPIATRFLRFMASHLHGGTLEVVDPDGTHRFGGGAPEVTMVVHDPAVYWSTLRQGSVGLGRDYADGLWDCDDLTTLATGAQPRPASGHCRPGPGRPGGRRLDRLVSPVPSTVQARRPRTTSGRTTTCRTSSSPSCSTRR